MKILLAIIALIICIYLLIWPVPIEPKAWNAPENPGYSGVHTRNERLAAMQRTVIAPYRGPEDLTVGPDGTLYTVSEDGAVLQLDGRGEISIVARVGGRPLGIARAADGALIVANAYLGLQRVSPAGTIGLLTNEVAGTPILYANNLALAGDGRIFFSDASTHFAAARYGSAYQASLLDLMEHDPNGRVLVYDPRTKRTEILLDGLSFANGVAIDESERYLLVVETGAYRIWRYWLVGARRGDQEIIIENLPGFPDNISRGLHGRFWVGLVSPRSPQLDALAGVPFARKIAQRLPEALRPAAVPYSHVIAIDGDGNVIVDLQHDGSIIAATTGAFETQTALYVTSLFGDAFGQLPKSVLDLPSR